MSSVELAYSIRWNKLYAPYKERGIAMEKIITECLKYMNKYLDFHKNVKVKIVPIKSIYDNGLYDIQKREIKINVRANLSIRALVETLCHEFIHAQQAYLLQLNSMNGCFIWKNKIYPVPKSNSEYRSLPWEVEAFGRQTEIANKIFKDLNIKDPNIPLKSFKG